MHNVLIPVYWWPSVASTQFLELLSSRGPADPSSGEVCRRTNELVPGVYATWMWPTSISTLGSDLVTGLGCGASGACNSVAPAIQWRSCMCQIPFEAGRIYGIIEFQSLEELYSVTQLVSGLLLYFDLGIFLVNHPGLSHVSLFDTHESCKVVYGLSHLTPHISYLTPHTSHVNSLHLTSPHFTSHIHSVKH